MSLKGTIFTTILILLFAWGAMVVSQKGYLQPANKNTGQPATAKEAAPPVSSIPAPDPKVVLAADAELHEALEASAALKKKEPDMAARVEEARAGYARNRITLLTKMRTEMTLIERARRVDQPGLNSQDLAELGATYGERVLALLQEVATAEGRKLSEFVSTTVPAEVMSYLTKEQADSGSFNAAVRVSYPFPARRVYFVNIDPGVGRYAGAQRLNALLDEYLAAVTKMAGERRRLDTDKKTAGARRFAELKAESERLRMQPHLAELDLGAGASAYNKALERVDVAQAKVDRLAVAQMLSVPEISTSPATDAQGVSEGSEPRAGNLMAKWTSTATGNTWAEATDEEKRALCRRLALASRKENSEAFFREGLDAFFESPDFRSENLGDVVELIEEGSGGLPRIRINR